MSDSRLDKQDWVSAVNVPVIQYMVNALWLHCVWNLVHSLHNSYSTVVRIYGLKPTESEDEV